MEQPLDILIAELKALNSVNLEIWNRITAAQDKDKNYVKKLMYIVFKDNTLSFRLENLENSVKINFLKIYDDNIENNIFGQSIKECSYTDLSSMIKNFEYINDRGVSIAASWKSFLDECHVYLGGLESHSQSFQVMKLFRLEKLETVQFRPLGETYLDFNIDLSEVEDPFLESLSDNLYSIYESCGTLSIKDPDGEEP
eukprot:TRINITY_DN2000_c0_g1_i1.p1 TRINITY_DN2000_c0_g1~~TRINITY_DN2000_c0_g1_i1.p1  ORF type:complete len:218 (+),score=39.94 TRINITY_DN2000_c0_g1_i1:61-654(+)